LMLQHGVTMVDTPTNVAEFNISETGSRPPGTQALDYFTSFGKVGNANYTWQRNFGTSLDALKAGKTFMAVGYLNDMAGLGALGQTNIGVAALPQVDVSNPQTYGRYLAATVTKQAAQSSKGRDEKKLQAAWDFVALFANPYVSDSYAKSLRVVPARKDVAKKQTFGEYYDPFISQVPYAVTWNKDEVAVADGALKEALTLAIDKKQDSQVALDVAAKGYTSFLQRDRGINTDEKVMNFWMSEDDTTVYKETIRNYLGENKDIKRIATSKRSPARFEWEILNAMAARKGPDLLALPSDAVVRYSPLLRGLPLKGFNKSTRISDTEALNLSYSPAVKTDNYINGKLYGMPAQIETLMIGYNSNLQNQVRRAWQDKNFETDPTDDPFSSELILWKDLKRRAEITSQVMQDVRYIALGTGSNVEHSADIFAAILKQYGGEMTDPDRNVTGIHLPISSRQTVVPGQEAEKLIRSYADTSSEWNSSLPNSLQALAEGKVVAAFIYPRDIAKIKALNPELSVSYIPLPQLTDTGDPIDFSSSYSLTVPLASKKAAKAYNFIVTSVFDGGQNDNLIPPTLGRLKTPILERRRGGSVQTMQRNAAQSYYKGGHPKEIDQAIIDFLDRKRTLDQTANVINQLLKKNVAD
ncbi:MAG TPA: extracellular solute-binding protein, partial [Patescibacteria group bacterium]